MSGKVWMGFVSVVNLGVVLGSIFHMTRKGLNAADMINAASGGVGLGAAGASTQVGLKLIAKLGARSLANVSEVELAGTVGKVVGGVGVFLALVQLGITGYQWYQGQATGTQLGLSAASAAGMVLLEYSLFAGTAAPAVALVGGILVIGSSIASIVLDPDFPDNLLSPFRSDAENWWLGVEKHFESGAIFTAVAAKNASLSAQAATFRSAITNTSFVQIDPSQKGTLSSFLNEDGIKALVYAP
jgi:hypothetical protein